MPESALAGRRVLVVEDEYFIAEDLDSSLKAAGAVVLGPVPSVEAALAMLNCEPAPDTAVLDVNLGGEMAHPVADALISRGVPFLFTTGYDPSSLLERHLSVGRLEKPVETSRILRELERLLVAA